MYYNVLIEVKSWVFQVKMSQKLGFKVNIQVFKIKNLPY